MVGTQGIVGAIYVCTGVGALAFLKPALENPDTAGSRSFAAFVVAVVGYALSSGLELFTGSYPLSVLAQQLTNCAGILASVAWLFLAMEVSDRVTVTRRLTAAVTLYVAVGWTLVLLNPGGLIMAPTSRLVGTNLVFDTGPGFWLLLGAGQLQVFAGTALLAVESFDATGLRRRQTGLLTVAILPALVASVVTASSLGISGVSYDYTVFGWAGTLVVFTVALYSGRFLDVSSIGRWRSFEEMDDPIVVVDRQDQVVDSNAAARSLVGIDDEWEGVPVAEFFSPFSGRAVFETTEPTETEITLERGGRQRHFVLNVSPIDGLQGSDRGRLLVLQEVTLLKEREQKLDLMRQVQSRVLRHNVRNDMQIVRTTVEMAAAEFEGQRAELADTALDTADELLSVSQKTRAVETLVDQEQTAMTIDLCDTLGLLVERYRERFPSVSFSVDAPDSCRVETIPAIELVFENLIENAAAHNDSDDPTVALEIEAVDTEAVVTIRDNGPGIPDPELAVIQSGEETPLEHGTGVGLWIIQWVLDHAAASIAYDTGPDGTTVTVRLPRPTDESRA